MCWKCDDSCIYLLGLDKLLAVSVENRSVRNIIEFTFGEIKGAFDVFDNCVYMVTGNPYASDIWLVERLESLK